METKLSDILSAREARARRQQALLGQYGKPLICFTMNIAGPEKLSHRIRKGFALGQEMLLAQLSDRDIVYQETFEDAAGCAGFYAVAGDPRQLKERMLQVEDSEAVCRLFDMDVLTPGGERLSRGALGYPERTCLLCGKSARICGRSRTHSVAQLQEKTDALLQEALDRRLADSIAALAVRSLLYEVCATPKPGLVDRANSGSHKDMDIFTFMSSAPALQPYFARCAAIGMETRQLPPGETFARLRLPGKLAQRQMLAATGGINTHKGAIFTLGILCGALGRLEEQDHSDPARVLSQCAAMAEGITARDFAGITPETAGTTGEKLYALHGITGVRGQAEQGFPAVLDTGLPVLEEGLRRGLSLNDAGCAALLAMLTATVDTNLIARSDLQTQRQTSRQVALLLARNLYPPREVLEYLDADFTAKNLSPGGTADLLAVTYFLHFLKQ